MTKMTAFLLLAIKYVLHFYFIFIVCVVCKVVPFLSNQRGKVLAELVEMEISTSATWAQDVSRASGSLAYNIPLSDSASADLCFCCHCQELRSQWMNRKESVGQSSSFITPSTLIFSSQLLTNHVFFPPFPSLPNPIAFFQVQIPASYR